MPEVFTLLPALWARGLRVWAGGGQHGCCLRAVYTARRTQASFPRGIRRALNVSVKPEYRKRAPIPPYKIQKNNGVGWNRCALLAFVPRTALPHTVFHAHTGNNTK